MLSRDINSWKSPKWHSDFGDPTSQFEALRNFSFSLTELTPEFSVELDCYEEGYMNVNIYLNGEDKIGELHAVDSDDYLYGLFLGDEEMYFNSIDEGIKLLKESRGQRT